MKKLAPVISIDKNMQYKVSIVVCLQCFRRWVAVRPTQTKLNTLECQQCGVGYVVETGEELRI